MGLRTIPIRRAGNRDNLFMGGDRELVMFSGLLSGVLIFAAQDWLAAAIGVVLWIGSLYFLRRVAKADPKMRAVYLRSVLRYKRYYPPRSTPFRNPNKGKRYQ